MSILSRNLIIRPITPRKEKTPEDIKNEQDRNFEENREKQGRNSTQ